MSLEVRAPTPGSVTAHRGIENRQSHDTQISRDDKWSCSCKKLARQVMCNNLRAEGGEDVAEETAAAIRVALSPDDLKARVRTSRGEALPILGMLGFFAASIGRQRACHHGPHAVNYAFEIVPGLEDICLALTDVSGHPPGIVPGPRGSRILRSPSQVRMGRPGSAPECELPSACSDTQRMCWMICEPDGSLLQTPSATSSRRRLASPSTRPCWRIWQRDRFRMISSQCGISSSA